jgi:protein tyrosine/serine phosphatase
MQNLHFKLRYKIGLSLLLLLLLVGYSQRQLIFKDNFGVIVPDEIYRSAQLDEEDLKETIQAHHIRTVINLRGSNPDTDWYTKEKEVCEKSGINHVDIKWSAQKLPPPNEMMALLEAFHTQPSPFLIHCKAGADRTGLAAAIYLIDKKGFTEQQASKTELTINHGHLAIYPYFEMDEFLDLYQESGKTSLISWVETDYPKIYKSELKESKWHEMLECLNLN